MVSPGEASISTLEAQYFRRRILQWHMNHARRYPWRDTRDAYKILIAEVLLQRTQAPQVAANYERFLEAFPSVQALAAARSGAIRVALRPFGLHKRGRTLKKMAEELVERFGGEVPSQLGDLVGLPGVGRYIASATLSFSGNARVPLVDTNVIRVLARFFEVISRAARPRDDPRMWEIAEALMPRTRAAEYNRALIDFSALICKPRNPACVECPLRGRCRAAPRFLDSSA